MAKHIWTSLTLLALLASCFAGAGKSGCDFDRHWRCFGAYGRYGGRVGGDGDYAGSLEYSNEAERLQRAYLCR
jgi:hypothetical protein